jgi:hypothetical protein
MHSRAAAPVCRYRQHSLGTWGMLLTHGNTRAWMLAVADSTDNETLRQAVFGNCEIVVVPASLIVAGLLALLQVDMDHVMGELVAPLDLASMTLTLLGIGGAFVCTICEITIIQSFAPVDDENLQVVVKAGVDFIVESKQWWAMSAYLAMFTVFLHALRPLVGDSTDFWLFRPQKVSWGARCIPAASLLVLAINGMRLILFTGVSYQGLSLNAGLLGRTPRSRSYILPRQALAWSPQHLLSEIAHQSRDLARRISPRLGHIAAISRRLSDPVSQLREAGHGSESDELTEKRRVAQCVCVCVCVLLRANRHYDLR